MGFLEYAWSIFFEKDRLKARLLVSAETVFPKLMYGDIGPVCIFPEPIIQESEEERKVSWAGYVFPTDAQGKNQLASLFRASVFHLGAHALSSNLEDYAEWKKRKDPRVTHFTITLLEDVKVNAYIAAHYPEKLMDIALANTLALKRLRRIDKMMNPATRIMAGLLVRVNTGLIVGGLRKELDMLSHLGELLDQFKERIMLSFRDEKVNPKEGKLRAAGEIYNSIIDTGTITEIPFFPHTEELGKCTTFFPSYFVGSDVTAEEDFQKHLKFLGCAFSSFEGTGEVRKKVAENEAVQVFDSWRRQKEKDTKMLSTYEKLLDLTSFKSVSIPEPDYTGYLRIRSRCKSEAHRLIESLLVARDALDEDPRKLYGALDLQEVIQVVASRSPSVDVFMLDENLSKSYSWIILFDASKSMNCMGGLALELLIMLTEVANELLMDPHSWGAYAFNDRLFVIKDPKERYNTRVRSRIGGIKFEGLTYLPDALKLGAQVIRARSENMKLVTVISDGWPCGYADADVMLKETIASLTHRNISVIGIGVQSRQMEVFFKSCSTVYNLRDLTKRFSNLYFEASNVASEA